jgi:hypothetical protein
MLVEVSCPGACRIRGRLMRLVVDVTDSAGAKTTLSKAITFKSRKKAKQKPA